jgi:tRNA(Ile)-lysidine synthase TilS/MesJ
MPAASLPNRFSDALVDLCHVCPGDAIVVGVSGGPDSLALLHLFVGVREALDLRLHAAHLNHGIRGAESDADFIVGAGPDMPTI